MGAWPAALLAPWAGRAADEQPKTNQAARSFRRPSQGEAACGVSASLVRARVDSREWERKEEARRGMGLTRRQSGAPRDEMSATRGPPLGPQSDDLRARQPSRYPAHALGSVRHASVRRSAHRRSRCSRRSSQPAIWLAGNRVAAGPPLWF